MHYVQVRILLPELTKSPPATPVGFPNFQNNLKAMSGNPLPQTPRIPSFTFLLERIHAKFNYELSRAEILAQAKFYAEYADGEISTALNVMWKGSDADEVQDKDEVWWFTRVTRKAIKPLDFGLGYHKVPVYFYGWTTYEKGGIDDPEAEEVSDCKPSDFPEYYL